MVKAIATRPPKTILAVGRAGCAPPAFELDKPSATSANTATTMVATMRWDDDASATAMSGIAAPTEKEPAELTHACTGRARVR